MNVLILQQIAVFFLCFAYKYLTPVRLISLNSTSKDNKSYLVEVIRAVFENIITTSTHYDRKCPNKKKNYF